MKLNSRRGFTLIELLVVMTLITTLAALALLIIPSINTNRRAADAADKLQQWLLIAKQRALRDQAPRGLRLIPDATGNSVSEMQYIETPENYAPVGGTTLFVRQSASLPRSSPTYQPQPRVVQVAGDITPFIREGDLLELTGVTNTQSGIYRIAGPNTWPWANGSALAPVFPDPSQPGFTRFEVTSEINEAKDANLVLSSNFRFIRQPKPFVGEEPLKFPDGVIIDLVPKTAKGVRPPLDILFAPSGGVVAGNAYTDQGAFRTVSANGKIVLHVADVEGRGQSTLLTIYSRNGLIAAHPPNTDPNVDGGDFYGYTSDGKSSGL